MALRVLSPSTIEPVTVDDLKDHLRITSTTEDVLLRRYIQVAARQAEHLTQRQLTTCSLQLTLSGFSTCIELPHPPVKSTSVSIEYLDSSGATATVDSTVYEVDVFSDGPAKIRLNYESTWPDTYDVENAVRITYSAGYPLSTLDNEPTTPWELKMWIMMRAGALYEHREGLQDGYNETRSMPRDHFAGLLDGYIVHNTGGF